MSLPKQVQAQLDEIERYDRELQAAQEPTPEPETEAEPEVGREQPAEPSSEQPKEQDALVPEASKSDEETWQRRFQTLQGKYNAEVPRLNAEVRELKSQLTTAIAKMDQQTQSPKAQATPQTPLVTDKDVEAFGSDLIDLVRRQAVEVARQELAEKLAGVEAENAKLLNTLQGVTERQGMTDRQLYFEKLAALVPDYEAINVDQGFLDWLAEVDDLSGLPRQEYLNNAFNTMDAPRTAKLFDTYKKQNAPAQTRTKEVPKTLQRQVAPGTSRASAPATQGTDDRLWSMRDIEQFYKQVARGDYRGKEAELARIEAEIDSAVAAGRLTP